MYFSSSQLLFQIFFYSVFDKLAKLSKEKGPCLLNDFEKKSLNVISFSENLKRHKWDITCDRKRN